MYELGRSRFLNVEPLFSNIKHSVPLVYSVLEQTHPGRVFVDDIDNIDAALIIIDDMLFIAGNADNETCKSTLYGLLYDNVFPGMKEEYFDFYTFSDEWRQKLEQIFDGRICARPVRKTFCLRSNIFNKQPNWRTKISLGFTMKQADVEFIEEHSLDKDFWNPSSGRFGFFLLKGNEIVSECTSVFVGRGQAEVSIHTKEQYRRQGYAALTASAFTEYCLSRGINPNWGCWEERVASRALAQKLGYEETDNSIAIVLKK